MPSDLAALWRLTPREVLLLIEGAAARNRRAWERTAWLGAQIINMAGKVAKRPVRPDELLGRATAIDAVEARRILEEQGRVTEAVGSNGAEGG